jgi:hypothetical protein
MSQTAAQIIEEKGGSAAFAKACGLEPSAVRMMKHRNKLPRSVWPEVMTAFPDLTLDVLMVTEAASAPEADAA